MPANIFMNVKNVNKFLNPDSATVAFIAVMVVLLVRQFNKTKNVADSLKTKKLRHNSLSLFERFKYHHGLECRCKLSSCQSVNLMVNSN
jgi:hypothetical protein